ncbi:hypothetical protein K466DRAFT_600998 [Polyporus arcularius HHB13444]|uniref:Uncharacterized protein n=1 Tax=Polyporus arcularius HHB13444 TaxID=1314778 RepID=A0A5C3P9R2_9APHY|nr:hypothetical protein K466DRAFT_600998 [Polyporus arcularius HHB13444]
MVKGSESHAETYPEDEYLFEIDDNPDPTVDSGLPWSFTERAQRAQAAKWDRLYKLFHPRPRDLLKYAEFHNIKMPLQEYLSGKLGKEYVKYGALSESDAQDEELLYYLDKCASLAVRKHLEHEARVKLTYVVPFSKIHDALFALYTNIEARERIDEIQATVGLADARDFIDLAIDEAGVQSELLWWYDRAGLRGVGLNYPC